MSSEIKIFDTTLRDGEQSPGASMNTAEKIGIAIQLEKLGVDTIEAGFPILSDGEFEAVSTISKTLKRAEVAALSRTKMEDIDRAWQAVKHAVNPKIHIFIATSDIHLEEKLFMTREKMLTEAIKAVSYARTLTDNVEFSAEDGSRSDRDFLCRVFEAVINAGANVVNLPDTVGYAIPKEFGELVAYVKRNTSNMDKAILSVHCHNDLGLATANTLAAIEAGARQVEVTINGIGERAGNTSLEEVIMTLRTRSNSLPFKTGVQTKLIHQTSRMVSIITGMVVQPNKAIVGANAFAHEAGIHQDGVLKNPMTYEIMNPSDIGLSASNLILGRHSGKHALRERLSQMGYALNDQELRLVFKKFKELADRKKYVVDEDLEILVAEGQSRTTDIFILDCLHVACGTKTPPMASIKLAINGQPVHGDGHGNGPIDAVFDAIAKLTETSLELLEFNISALSSGADSQGRVTVRVQEDGLMAIGQGNDPDIVVASAKAYLNGLNRLEYLKQQR
ncbi:MAG: 2-isopropylmalate synthase [Patescibacteria group bacterium]|nr:2-isopropylmalate synthase [Patescibacteria group bacterium]